MLVLESSCYFVADHAALLHCNPALGPVAAGNIGKIARIYTALMIVSGTADKYPKEVHFRSAASIRKKIKPYFDKKRMDALSLKFRSIFAGWDAPQDVAANS